MMNWTPSVSPLSFSSTDTLPDLILCPLPSWSSITMVGDDKKSYLQGQITNNVVTLEANKSTLGAHCDAKGKMLSVFQLFHHNHGYALFQRRSAIEKELVEIKKYAVFSKIEILQSDDVCIGLIGEQADSFINGLNDDDSDVRAIAGGTAVRIDRNRWLLLISNEQVTPCAESALSAGATLCDESIWDWADVISARPRLDAAEQLEHIPQAMNLQALDGISFTKGCYTGQETIARAKYRGINKRAMFLLEGQAGSTLPDDLSVERQVGENWRNAGKLLAHYHYSDNKLIGLAVLPNNLDTDTRLRLTQQPESELTFGSLPYSLQQDD